MPEPSGVETLFTPFDVKSLRLKNRFVMAPMSRYFATGGVPNQEMAAYYARRAAGGVGLIVTEGTYVGDPAAGPNARVPHFYGAESLSGWQRVVEAVHAEGVPIIPQLWHTGAYRGNAPEFNPAHESVSPSGIGLTGEPVGRALSASSVERIFDYFAESAVHAQRLGFDGLEIHGAHGYLPDQFMWSNTNRRDDIWAESSAFSARLVARVRSAVGSEFPIFYRFSQWKLENYDARLVSTPDELRALLSPLVEAGVDVFHASTRRYWLPEFPEEVIGEGRDRNLSGWVREVTGVPTVTVGSVGLDHSFYEDGNDNQRAAPASLAPLIERFDRGEFDLVAVGRALLSDPEWVNKIRDGRVEDLIDYRVSHRSTLS